MAMAPVEPPLKKRRGLEEAGADVAASSSRYEDMEMSPEASQQIQQGNAAGIGDLSTAAETQTSEDVVKRRNRSEISSLYRAYRTLKGCLARHPSMGPELDSELEKAYSTLLKLASGCTSVRRIAAELIPRYAVFCPTALDPASRVILQICEWTSSVLMQGETGDTIIADTAQACFAGLIELSVASNSAALSFPGLRGVCAGVCHNVVAYLLCQLNGAPLVYQEGVSLKEDGEALDCHRFFGTLVSSTLSKLFCCDPETVLVSCFKLLTDAEQRKHATHFLTQLLAMQKAEEMSIKDHALSDGTENHTEKATSEVAGESLLGKALYQKPNVERHIVSMVRTFRICENAAIVEEALPNLLALVKALRTFSPCDLELTVAPSLEQEPAKSPARSRSRSKSEDGVATRTGRPGDHMFGEVEIDGKDIAQQEGDTRSKTSSALSSPLGQKVSPTSAPIAWYRDGDPAAMDVFAASEHLWVGFFGSGVTEHMLRSEFGTFGQLESTILLREQGFAIVEFKHIRDAVEARDTMQGAVIWGKQLRVKFLDPFHGSRGVFSGVAVGGSRHIWVGRIPSQISKDELLKDLASAGFKHPVSVACLIPSRALLLEFDVPEEAAAVMLHIRRRRRDGLSRVTSIGGGNNHLWVGKIDASVSEDELLSAFSQFGEITGWKFLRSSACCFIGFRLPEQAAAAKSRLDGTRFVNQPIVVEFKSIQHRSSPRGSSLQSPPARAAASSLASTLENLCAKFAWGLTGASKQRPSRFTQVDPEKVPTKVLWLGLPESASPDFMNESELRTIFDLAADGTGTVTKVLSARTRRGPCRFVEFDAVDAAVTALQNIARHLEPGIQIEFSCPTLLQQPRISDHPRRQGFEDYCSADRHPMVYDGHKDGRYDYPYSRRPCSPRHYGESISPAMPAMVDPSVYRSQAAPVHPPGFDRAPSGSSWQGSPARAPRVPCNTPPPLPCESPLLSSPPPPPPLQPPPRCLALAAPVSACIVEHSWRGPLCKSGLQYCEVMVHREASPFAGYAGDLCEPARWPDKLDVTKRADLKSVKQTISSFPLNQREICRLCACPSEAGEHRNGFVHFMDYLKQRDRAGVVKIPAAHGLWARLLYIMPWTAEASVMFSVPAEPAESLICVVLPSVLPQ